MNIKMDQAKLDVKRLYEVAAVIERYPKSYDQNLWMLTPRAHYATFGELADIDFAECGTFGCVAGHIAATATDHDKQKVPGGLLIEHAAGLLAGLSAEVAANLFDGDWRPPEGVSVPQALRWLADTGELLCGE